MKLSIESGSIMDRYGTEEGARLIKAAGFEAVDYTGANSTFCYDGGVFALPEKEFLDYFEKEGRKIEATGLELGQMHCPANSPPDRITPEQLTYFTAAVKRSLRAAAVMGIPIAVVHPVIPVGWQENAQISYDITDRLCFEYAELAEQLGITVALENMPGDDTNVPYSYDAQFLNLLQKLKSPSFGICLDTGHANWALPKGKLPDMARTLVPHLACVHLHDNGGTWDNHFTPFGGTIDWNALCVALGEGGYSGNINLEVHPAHGASDGLFFKTLEYQCAVAAELRDKIIAAQK